MENYSRPLYTKEAVEDFLTRVLDFRHRKIGRIVDMIIDGELGNDKIDETFETLTSLSMRVKNFRDEQKRWELREVIIDELLSLKRLADDEKIKLGKGGALPNRRLKSEAKAFILVGLPASGKSSIASGIAEDYGAVILDSDFAKRKLPEYRSHFYGASLVHAESSQITFGFESSPDSKKVKSLFRRCIDAKYNLVIPKIGQNPTSIITLAETLRHQHGYEVHLILVSLSKKEATKRAVMRYFITKRYVPLGLIFDWYGNDPSHSYYYLRAKKNGLFKSFGVVSTESRPAMHTDIVRSSPVKKYNYIDKTLILP